MLNVTPLNFFNYMEPNTNNLSWRFGGLVEFRSALWLGKLRPYSEKSYWLYADAHSKELNKRFNEEQKSVERRYRKDLNNATESRDQRNRDAVQGYLDNDRSMLKTLELAQQGIKAIYYPAQRNQTLQPHRLGYKIRCEALF